MPLGGNILLFIYAVSSGRSPGGLELKGMASSICVKDIRTFLNTRLSLIYIFFWIMQYNTHHLFLYLSTETGHTSCPEMLTRKDRVGVHACVCVCAHAHVCSRIACVIS